MTSDLISRQAVLDLVDDYDLWKPLAELPTITPSVVCNITGGVLQGASSDYPVDVYTLDFDTQGANRDELSQILGEGFAYVSSLGAEVDPLWVGEIKAIP